MKILFLSAANSIHTVRWVNALVSRKHEIHLVYNEGHNPDCNKLDKRILLHPLKYQGTKGYYFNAFQLRRLAKQIKPDVINVHYASGYGTLARKSKIGPYLLSIWGSDVYDFPNQGILKKRILTRNVKSATMLASTSQCMANELRNVMNDQKLNIAITPFGVDLSKFDVRKYETKSKGKLSIGIIKTLEEVYRINDFILSIDELIKLMRGEWDRPKEYIHVEIYGEGSQKEELMKLTRNLKLDDVIHFKGYIPNNEVPEILHNFDIFCVTSKKESFGVAVVEAMAMEKPVVATDAEGFKEVMIQGNTGLIVEAENVQAIAKALKFLVDNPEVRRLYGENGRQRVEQLYDWEKNVDIMENLYKELLN